MRHLLILAALLPTGTVHAQQAVMQYQEYEKRIRASEMVGALKSDLFGDSVSLYNGATEFSATDIDLPGNGPPVRLSRLFKVQVALAPEAEQLPGFGAGWNIEVPHITGMFDAAYGWNGGGGAGFSDNDHAVTSQCLRTAWRQGCNPVPSDHIQLSCAKCIGAGQFIRHHFQFHAIERWLFAPVTVIPHQYRGGTVVGFNDPWSGSNRCRLLAFRINRLWREEAHGTHDSEFKLSCRNRAFQLHSDLVRRIDDNALEGISNAYP